MNRTVSTTVSTESDVGTAALRAALDAEHVAVYGYGVVGAYLWGAERTFAREAWNSHRARRDRLRRILTERGSAPPPAAPAYRLPYPVDGPRTAARLAARLEEGAVGAYIGLVAADDRGLRRMAALAMQECARRATHWRGSSATFPGLPPGAISRSPSAGPTRR